MTPTVRLRSVLHGSRDPQLPAGFTSVQDEPGGVKIVGPDGGTALAFQLEPEQVAPVALGAEVAEHPPEEGVLMHRNPP